MYMRKYTLYIHRDTEGILKVDSLKVDRAADLRRSGPGLRIDWLKADLLEVDRPESGLHTVG